MPSYSPVIHRCAERELDNLPDDQRARLTDTIADIAREREPTSHEKVTPLKGQDGLLRVRVGNIRAVISLAKPELRVLSVGHRSTIYDTIDKLDDRRMSV